MKLRVLSIGMVGYIAGNSALMEGGCLNDAAPPGHLKRAKVEMAPVLRLLSGAPLPIFGDDPRIPGLRKVFSAAPLKVNGRDAGYVYVVLFGEERDSVAAHLSADSVLRSTLWSMGLVTLLGLPAGLAAFYLITRPLRQLTEALRHLQADGLTALDGAGAGVQKRRRNRHPWHGFCRDDPAYRRSVARTDGAGAAATRTVRQHIARSAHAAYFPARLA